MAGPLHLTTGDVWDEDATRPTGGPDPAPAEVEPSMRRSRDYIGRFVERDSALRSIRRKCNACMGGDPDRQPRGEVARQIDECGSSTCPLWAFRFGTDPWRPAPSEAQRNAGRGGIARARARLETGQTTSAQKADDESDGTQAHPMPAAPIRAGCAKGS